MIKDIVAIDDAIEALKNKWLVIAIVEGLEDYLSWKIKFSDDKKHAWLGQSHLVKNLERKFGGLFQDIWSHKTPCTPKVLNHKAYKRNQEECTGRLVIQITKKCFPFRLRSGVYCPI